MPQPSHVALCQLVLTNPSLTHIQLEVCGDRRGHGRFSGVGLFAKPYGLWPARLLCPWDSLVKSTGVGCHFLLQGIFQTQGSNPGLLCLQDCRRILYPLSYLEQIKMEKKMT